MDSRRSKNRKHIFSLLSGHLRSGTRTITMTETTVIKQNGFL
jgi:hypothetical protein